MAMADPALLQPAADWPAYGGSYSARRYSPLAQITPENVGGLKRAWLIHTGDLPSSKMIRDTYGAENTRSRWATASMSAPPRISCSPSIPRPAGSAGGSTRVPDSAIPYTAACRGVSYYAVPDAGAGAVCSTRIIFGTLDARLFAIDARTGKPCEDFGTHGQVDTKIGMGDTPDGYVSITSPPTIVRGVVVTGHQVLDGQDRWAPSGVIRGFDAATGKLRWAWDMMHPDWNGYPPRGRPGRAARPICGRSRPATSNSASYTCRWAIRRPTITAACAVRRRIVMRPRWWRST
jgi:quinoprotein glucose dehydrogenase